MPLLNYTSKLSPEQTMAQIQKVLVAHGARGILYDYDDNGTVKSLSFKLVLKDRDLPFRLPCDWRPVLKILETIPKAKKTEDQAIKTAWKIVHDWVLAQMAIIDIKMVKMEEVFLPYMVTDDGRTVFERAQENPMFLLPPPQ